MWRRRSAPSLRRVARSLMGVLVLLVATSSPARAQDEADERARSDRLYEEARAQLQRQDHTAALATLERYLDFTSTPAQPPERVFWALDQVVHILLGEKRDPDAAIALFGRLRDDARLGDVDRAAIDEWISVSQEWKSQRAEKSSLDAKNLLERAHRYYESGRKKREMDMDDFAQSDFQLATGYLLQFAIHYDKRPEVVDALLMLGSIRSYLHADTDHWSDNYYLKEVIRRFPHTAQSEEAMALLREEVSRSYKAKEIPPALTDDLALYQEMAKRDTPKR